MRPAAVSNRRFDNPIIGIGCMDDLAVPDIDTDVPFVPNSETGDFGDGINRSFFYGVLIHRVRADVGHSVCAVFHLMAVCI